QIGWESNALDRVRELLGKYDSPPQDKDLRGFEWFYWNRLAHSYALDLRWHRGPVWCATCSADGTRIASAGADGTVCLVDAATGELVHRFTRRVGQIRSLAFTPDGKALAVSGDDQTIILWDLASGESVRKLTGHTGVVYSLAFDPKGKRIASASTDQS